MKEDLIDHFCCAIEELMKKGVNFETSYDKAYQNICPEGFDEIQRETVFLLTFKKIKVMKQLTYVFGYLTAIGITATVFMKSWHIEGGQIALFATAAVLVFLFLPTLFVNQYKRELIRSTNDKLKYMSGLIGTILLIAFVVFQTSHWPGAAMIFITSAVIINFIFFPFLFFKKYRKSVE